MDVARRNISFALNIMRRNGRTDATTLAPFDGGETPNGNLSHGHEKKVVYVRL